jgi:hypothetical protein
MKKDNQNVPAGSKLNLLRRICSFIPDFLVSKIARETGVGEKVRSASAFCQLPLRCFCGWRVFLTNSRQTDMKMNTSICSGHADSPFGGLSGQFGGSFTQTGALANRLVKKPCFGKITFIFSRKIGFSIAC